MAYSNPSPPLVPPSPTVSNIGPKPGPMPPITKPAVPGMGGRLTPEQMAAIMDARRAALQRMQPIYGPGRNVPSNELPPPALRGRNSLMDGRGRPGGGYEAMPMPAQITPEMVQRWWNGGGQYGNPQSGGIIGAGLERRPDNRGVGLPPPMDPRSMPPAMPPSPEPPMQAMLPDQGVNQAPSRPQRPQRPPAFSNVNDINNRYGVDAANWYGDNGLTNFGRQGWAQLLAERFGQVGNVNDINNRFGVDASGWYGDNGAITDQGRQGWLAYMMSMNPYYGGF